jgi:tetratricopeptide (TPR) repeat protein
MKKNCLLLLLVVVGFTQPTFGQFQEQFEKAKKHLYAFQPEKALPILLNLYKKDPDNHNLEYLIGAAYTDFMPEKALSIAYLEKAKPFVVDDYDADAYDERGVSIHLYYFLAVGYAQNNRCEKAAAANKHFHTLIGKVGQAYLRDAQFWVDACNKLNEKPRGELTLSPEEVAAPNEPKELKENKIVTQSVEYNTPTPLYGVQVGSFSKYSPSERFDDIKNVNAFLDKTGHIRYVVGNFTFRRQAETLMKVLQESGYTDAFIVDVNKERKFSERIITVNDVSIKSHIRGTVHFRCQIGAFRDTIPEEMARKYLKISGIRENRSQDMTLLSVGHFPTYEEAKSYLNVLHEVNINDAFVVAYNHDEKITVKDAITFLNKQEKANEKKQRK